MNRVDGVCWCGRPSHDDLIDGCVGDRLLHAMFGPPTMETMIRSAILMCGDLLALAASDDEESATAAQAVIDANPIPGPSIEMDRRILELAGMDVTADNVRSIRARYGGEAT